MRPYELIKSKRQGSELSDDDIRAFIAGLTNGSIPEYQMAAMCMAIFFKGLSPKELAAWTQAMLESGDTLDLADVPGVKVDKHSTGGVGDKVSICLAPWVAACGVPVPMISGRGLGHSGGTLDKLEAIPGFRVDLNVDEFRRMVREVGASLIGQTARLAPADKKLYALRDVTATVDCIPLIASSIMSKKLAEGIDALVLDVKVGSGAFMKQLDDARTLAKTLIGIGERTGKKVVALLTDMDQPLGRTVGNALEVAEAIAVLEGKGPADLTEVTVALAEEMVLVGRRAPSRAAAREMLEEAISTGSALRKLEELIRAHGGDARVVSEPSRLPTAKFQKTVVAPSDGFVTVIDAEAIGLAAMGLGAGRARVDSVIDPAVGFVLEKKVGDAVKQGEAIATIHFNDEALFEATKPRVLAAYRFGPRGPAPRPLLLERIEGS